MKAESNEFPYVTFSEQGSTPSTPGSGLALIYRKTDNAWYFLDDAGTETAINTGGASAYVLQSLADAKGDLIIASADDTFAKHTAPADGSQLVADSGESDGWGSILHNYAGTAAPDADNDVDEGYAPGSFWFDTTNDKAYVCLDSTDGAAVWTEITGGGAAPGGGPSLPVETYKSSASPSANTWQALATDVDLVIAAAEGDILEVHVGYWSDNQNSHLYFDFYTMPSGSPTNRISGNTAGIPGAAAGYSAYGSQYGTELYTVQAGDIDGGDVTLRPYVLAVHNTTKSIGNIGMWVRNLGQA